MFLHCPFVKFPLLVICSAIVLAALGLKGHFGEMGEKRVYVPLLVMFQDLPLRGVRVSGGMLILLGCLCANRSPKTAIQYCCVQIRGGSRAG